MLGLFPLWGSTLSRSIQPITCPGCPGLLSMIEEGGCCSTCFVSFSSLSSEVSFKGTLVASVVAASEVSVIGLDAASGFELTCFLNETISEPGIYSSSPSAFCMITVSSSISRTVPENESPDFVLKETTSLTTHLFLIMW